MKILLPIIDNETNKDVLASSFHDTRDICIYDVDKSSYEYMCIDELGGSMRDLPGALKQHEIESIISMKIRPLALQIFERFGLKVYEASGSDMNKNLDLFRHGELQVYTVEASRELLACGGSCTSCTSSSCN